MRHIVVHPISLLTLAAVALAGVTPAQADPTALLNDPADFSGSETLLSFDDLGLENGDDVGHVAGVDLVLTSGGSAKFMLDGFPREIGPEGPGSVNNFWGYVVPYPDLMLRFPHTLHRLGFELRANVDDDVAVSLLASGSIVDEVTIESRGDDQLYFYAFENEAGFDEVLLDVVANASGAFTLDNLRFESFEAPEQGPPVLSCVGFTSPWEALLEHPETARYAAFWKHWLKRAPVKLLRARLLDEKGVSVGDADLPSPPVVQVLFTPAGEEGTLDVTAEATWKESFTFAPKGYWRIALKAKRIRRPGSYLIRMASGDESEYRIDPTCSESSVTPARKRRSRH